jgi:hypothetical protein
MAYIRQHDQGAHRGGRFLFFRKERRDPVNVPKVLNQYGANVVNVLGEDMAVAVVTGEILERVEHDNPGIAFEEDVRMELAPIRF